MLKHFCSETSLKMKLTALVLYLLLFIFAFLDYLYSFIIKLRYVLFSFCVSEPPKITSPPKDTKVIEDELVSFFCKASGNPLPVVYWRKGGKRLTSNSRYSITIMPQGSVLRFEEAKPSKDEATYECVASNENGEDAVASARLKVYPRSQGNYPYSFFQLCHWFISLICFRIHNLFRYYFTFILWVESNILNLL